MVFHNLLLTIYDLQIEEGRGVVAKRGPGVVVPHSTIESAALSA